MKGGVLLVFTISLIACTIHVSSLAINPSSKVVSRVKREDDPYTTEFDDFDVDGVLHSDRLMKSYIKCILDKGPCTKEGRLLKQYIPDALLTDCKKCSEMQKKQGGKVLSVVLQNYRQDWDLIVNKYDPTGAFRKKYGYHDVDENLDDEEGDEA